MLAQNIWQGVNSTFADPINWSLGHVPLQTEELVFDGDISSTSTTLINARTSYAGIRLIDSYTGTVTLPRTLSVEDFEMRTGAIAQTSSNSVLTVESGSFVWTAGTLNNTTTTATVKIIGVDDAVMGLDSTSITTGSTIRLERYGSGTGTELSVAGTVVFDNEADLLITAACQVQPKDPTVTPPKVKKGVITDPTKNIIYVYDEGELTTRGGFDADKMGIVVDGGDVIVSRGAKSNGDLTATGRTSADADAPSVLVKRGSLQIQNEDKVVALHGVLMDEAATHPGAHTDIPEKGTVIGARLWTLASGEAARADRVATIDGKLTVKSGVIDLGKAFDGHSEEYSTLKVTKDFEFLGGTYDADVYATDGTVHDTISSDEKMKFDSAAKITPVVQFGTAQANTVWDVLEALKGLNGTAMPDPGTGWTMSTTNIPGNTTGGKYFGVRKL